MSRGRRADRTRLELLLSSGIPVVSLVPETLEKSRLQIARLPVKKRPGMEGEICVLPDIRPTGWTGRKMRKMDEGGRGTDKAGRPLARTQ